MGLNRAVVFSLLWYQGSSLIAVGVSPDYTHPATAPVLDWELTILGAPVTPITVEKFGDGLTVYHPALAANPATNLKYTEGPTRLHCGDLYSIPSFDLAVPYP